ncbi:hypothetical protein CK203_040721 [Vitis vinifera]|uniref:Uncharacterized protein n=1 Tax=Vitis vinifera TaxID=29760 RepID=A0A438HFD3_VITVI|nr:hypothetical protein CK203_040721 [Vitis vinifera]
MTVTRTSKLCTQKREGKSRKWGTAMIGVDLFLLENQLPFGVLKLIFEEVEFNIDGSPMQEMIKKFVIDTGRPEGSTSEIQLEEPSHLLDLLRSALLGGSKKSSKQEAQRFCCPWKKGKQQGNRLSF